MLFNHDDINAVIESNINQIKFGFHSQAFKSFKNRDFEKVRRHLTKCVHNCKDMSDIQYLRKDVNAGINMLNKRISNNVDSDEFIKELKYHVKWLQNDYRKLLNEKAKEIKNK